MRAGFRDLTKAVAVVLAVVLLWAILSPTLPGCYALLGLAYGAFFFPIAHGSLKKTQLRGNRNALFGGFASLCLVSLLLAEKSHIYPLYPLASALAYLLLLAVILAVVHAWIFSVPHTMQLHFQKRYLIYGLALVFLFWATTTMDRRDPYGPHFQLKMVVLIMFALLVVNWFTGQWQLVKALESANLKAELDHLKSQIQPHFLFNTLNNLYGLARDKSEHTETMILKLSELLRYGLYQAQKDRVPLSKEIEYLQNYIALQQLRHSQGLEVTMNIQPISGAPTIAPLLLIPLLENAFKHGADLLTEGAFIHTSLKMEKGKLHFRIENNYPEDKTAAPGGLGLANLGKRLQLLYPNRHEFHFESDRGRATADLGIIL